MEPRLACENSRPSSLPAEWNATRPGAKKDGCFRRLNRALRPLYSGLNKSLVSHFPLY